MNFHIKVIDEVCKIREKFNRQIFIVGYIISPEEPFDDGITMTETLKLVKVFINKFSSIFAYFSNEFFPKSKKRRAYRYRKT